MITLTKNISMTNQQFSFVSYPKAICVLFNLGVSNRYNSLASHSLIGSML